ncbi:hypothetical protein DFH06DRAFT_1333829 [Mycena polygramma]|nr:hypothetical protein DFH06DRAFT_1333829 [Mycena polygramma]
MSLPLQPSPRSPNRSPIPTGRAIAPTWGARRRHNALDWGTFHPDGVSLRPFHICICPHLAVRRARRSHTVRAPPDRQQDALCAGCASRCHLTALHTSPDMRSEVPSTVTAPIAEETCRLRYPHPHLHLPLPPSRRAVLDANECPPDRAQVLHAQALRSSATKGMRSTSARAPAAYRAALEADLSFHFDRSTPGATTRGCVVAGHGSVERRGLKADTKIIFTSDARQRRGMGQDVDLRTGAATASRYAI